MKTKLFTLSILGLLNFAIAEAQDVSDGKTHTNQVTHVTGLPVNDSIKLQVDNGNAYYQKVFKVDSSINVSTIYNRVLEYMAAKNFQQNYGYAQEGKMIFSSTQDLNTISGTAFQNDDILPQPYTVQFAFIVDIKNGRYRCTISHVVFFLPSDYGNKRITLFELYQKETSNEPKRIIRNARSLRDSFEKYLIELSNGLYTEVEHKAEIYSTKF